MIATKQELKKYIGMEVWILPTGQNKQLKSKDIDCIYSCTLIKVTSLNAYFDNNVSKLKLDGSCDEKNNSGLIFTSKEKLMNFLWTKEFSKFLKNEFNFSLLSFENLKEIEKMVKEVRI